MDHKYKFHFFFILMRAKTFHSKMFIFSIIFDRFDSWYYREFKTIRGSGGGAPRKISTKFMQFRGSNDPLISARGVVSCVGKYGNSSYMIHKLLL